MVDKPCQKRQNSSAWGSCNRMESVMWRIFWAYSMPFGFQREQRARVLCLFGNGQQLVNRLPNHSRIHEKEGQILHKTVPLGIGQVAESGQINRLPAQKAGRERERNREKARRYSET